MKYEKIKTYFEKGIEGLTELLKDTEDVRNAIEDDTQELVQGVARTADDYKKALNKFDGYYGYVATVAGIAEVYADSQEANSVINTKRTPVDDGTGKVKAPTDEIVKAQGKLDSAEHQRIATLFDRYAKICEKRMMTIQSQLNRIEFEILNPNK